MADMDEIKAAVQEEDCTSLANWRKDLSLISRQQSLPGKCILKNTFFKIQYWQIKGGVASVSEAKAIQSQLSMIRISTFESIWPALFIIPLLLFDIHIMKWCLGIRNVIFWFLCTLRSFIITEDPVLKPLSVVLLMQERSPALDMLQLMLHYKQLGLISD